MRQNTNIHIILAIIFICLIQSIIYFINSLNYIYIILAFIPPVLSCFMVDKAKLGYAIIFWIIVIFSSSLAVINLVKINHFSPSLNTNKEIRKEVLELDILVVSNPVHIKESVINFTSVDLKDKSRKYNVYMPIGVNSKFRVNKGDFLKVLAKVYFIDITKRNNPFSYYGFLSLKGISKNAYIKEILEIKKSKKTKTPFIYKLYSSLYEKYKDYSSLSIISASTLGIKKVLSPKTIEVFNNLGLSHLLVVSGFHLSVIWGGCFLFISSLFSYSLILKISYPRHFISSIVSTFIVVFYVYLIDGKTSSIRALITMIIVSGGVFFGRKIFKRRCIWITLFICLITYPLGFLNVGLELTFLALFGIWTGAQLINLTNLEGLKKRVLMAFSVFFFAWMFTSSVLIFRFNYIVLISPICNLLFTPLFSIISIGGAFVSILLFSISQSIGDSFMILVLNLTEVLVFFMFKINEVIKDSLFSVYYLKGLEKNILGSFFLLSSIVTYLGVGFFKDKNKN